MDGIMKEAGRSGSGGGGEAYVALDVRDSSVGERQLRGWEGLPLAESSELVSLSCEPLVELME